MIADASATSSGRRKWLSSYLVNLCHRRNGFVPVSSKTSSMTSPRALVKNVRVLPSGSVAIILRFHVLFGSAGFAG